MMAAIIINGMAKVDESCRDCSLPWGESPLGGLASKHEILRANAPALQN